MISLTPSAFFTRFCAPFEPADHHYTGPIIARQTEGHGSVFHEEGRILANYAAEFGGPVLEIGSDLGISSRYIREGIDAFSVSHGHWNTPEQRLFCVDIDHKWDSRIYDTRIEQFHMTADKFTPPAPCTWAFIDGDHQYAAVVKDIARCRELGIARLFFHDTTPDIPAAKSAAEGSDARRAVLDTIPDWELYDIQTHCGMIFACRS